MLWFLSDHAEATAATDGSRALLQEMGLEGFADACGLHRTYMGSVERGETNPTLSSLATIARALKITTSKLVEGVD